VPDTASEAAVEIPLTVDLHGVSKRYLLFSRRRDRALALLGRTRRLASLTALEEVDLQVRAGEAVGLIGENGSGKSTLLRLVAGISRPDAGTIHVASPVAAILELGLGFHPEFTGRENALLYGSLLGLDEGAMTEILEEALAFAELGEFVEHPLRTYSSGMTARLAFAVATSVDPQVLVVDEALAVGDGAFQKKCIDRMVRFKDEGRTVLFCSHAMYLVTSFCDRAVWLHRGRVRKEGRAQGVVEEYEAYLMQREKRRLSGDGAALPEELDGSLAGRAGRLTAVRVCDLAGNPARDLEPGSGLRIDLDVESVNPATRYHVAVAVDSLDGRCIFAAATQKDGAQPLAGATRYSVQLRVPHFPVGSGSFVVSGFLFDEHGLHIYDQVVVAGALRIAGGGWNPSLVHAEYEWRAGR
jgi:ABC-type polysaccharide/polyol phosphate transport system ATPase subunit